ncbi:MAG: 50S ribosomal protein L2 [Nitrospinota bacterium]|nr:50S ribosomal protein L2 [Nitrospinota bacterium]
MAGFVITKPTSPGRRHQKMNSRVDLDAKKPEKKLTSGKKRIDGRNHAGRITMRFRGGGHKRKYRLIDFKRNKDGIPAVVEAIEYDPNRSSRIALVLYADGERRYIIAPDLLNAGDKVSSGENAEIRPGCTIPLAKIPVGTFVHAIELRPGKGAQLVRSAGGSAQLLGKEGDKAIIKLTSGEVRLIPLACRATIGVVGNQNHNNEKIGKAGKNRWLGNKPHNRGVTMNPVDHPHGGGEGRTSGGRHPCTPWGIPTKGYKTRKKRNPSSKMIIKRRKK